ncbi:MAG: aminoglycoside phosphotransferase family protein [Legionella sp.]|uniref:aminoglycoside phosphotransferase family protein n=1 Tax=Legionella sp. TaxID=459 RepID=UPI0039E44ECF
MNNHSRIFKWARDYLASQGYFFEHLPHIVQETPWSNVFRFTTSKGDVYLKQPAPLLAQEAKVLQLLRRQFNASVPLVMAINDDLHCFLMQDAGISLRRYLKSEFHPDLLCQAIKAFAAFQRSIENNIEPFLALEVPDWQLNKLPELYKQIINQTDFLKADGMTDKELQTLHDLCPQLLEESKLLSEYNIPETIVQPDCNTNNILICPNNNEFTFIDLGELAISHPFFSLHNFLYTATIHHGVKETDKICHQLQDACIENWLELEAKEQLMKAFRLAKKLWPIYSACVNYRFMHCVNLQALNSWYADKPNRLAEAFRQYIASV